MHGSKQRRRAAHLGTGAVAALVLGLGAVAFADAHGGAAEPSQDEVVGRQDFVRYCAACHGTDGRGTGSMAGELKTPPADLTRIAARRNGVFPQAEILRIVDGRDPVVSHGSREMPIWGLEFRSQVQLGPASEGVARGQALLIVRYLERIQVEDAPDED